MHGGHFSLRATAPKDAQMTTRTLFPTLVREEKVSDLDFAEQLEKVCWLLAEEDDAGNAWCEEQGYGGYTSYASLDDLPERFPEFAELKSRLAPIADDFAKQLHWDMDGLALQLDAIWVNILEPGFGHSNHIHPGSVLSGTYYISVPEGSGRLKLEDPRLSKMMAAPQLVDDVPESARRFIYLPPSIGHAFFWESWLRHEVPAGPDAEEPRVSISFNYALKRL